MRRKALNGAINAFTRERHKLTLSDEWLNLDAAECGFLFTYKWDDEISPEMIVEHSIFTIYGDGAVLDYEDVDYSVGYLDGEIYIEYIIHLNGGSSFTEMSASANVYMILNINNTEYEFVYNYYEQQYQFSKFSVNDYLINYHYDDQFYIGYEIVFDTNLDFDLGNIVDTMLINDSRLYFNIALCSDGYDYFDTRGIYRTSFWTDWDSYEVNISDNKIYIVFTTANMYFSSLDWDYEGDMFNPGYQDVVLDGSDIRIDVYTSNDLKLICRVEV